MRRVTLLLVTGLSLTVGACATAPTPTAAPDTSRTPVTKAALPEGKAALPEGKAALPDGAMRGGDLAPPPAVALEAPKKGGTEDYRLAPKDQLTVTVLGQDELTRTVRVSGSGTITLPLVGELPVAGLSVGEAEQKITTAYSGKYLVNPRITVSVTEFQGRQISVMGAVNQPGSYALRQNYTTVMLALSEAKGVKDNADRMAYVLRAQPRPGEPQPLNVDLDALLRVGNPKYNVVIEPGDSVYVPEANTYYVAGEIEKRGAYTLRRDTTVSKAITEAGGVTKRASTSDIKIIRTLPTGEKKEITGIDLKAVMAGDRSQDVTLQAHDVIVVPSSSGKVAAYGVLDFLRGLFSIGITP